MWILIIILPYNVPWYLYLWNAALVIIRFLVE